MSNDNLRVGYFGKLPGCGDFVRSPGHHVLVDLLDQWLAKVMHRLAGNPRWRQHYDAVAPLQFAFVGTRSQQLVAGHLLPSCDQSQRRFPFACVGVQQVHQPRAFLPCSPLALAPAWTTLARAAGSGNPGDVWLERASPDVVTAREQLALFLECETLAGMELQLDGLSMRHMLLAIGLLLSPLRQRAPVPSRALSLPLPKDAAARPAVAAFWMALAEPLLERHDLELSIYLAAPGGRPALVLGLDGANPATLQAIIDPEAARDGLVDLGQCGWVEGALPGQPHLQRLAACLEQGAMGLPAAIELYRETFA